ncbi:MAG: hypothetical protein EOL91_02710 [Actinobacteria bacterium]|nr:hypothetical protein [Actinomycetota bacterium]
MTDKKQNADTDAIKAKMREALDRKAHREHASHEAGEGGAQKLHGVDHPVGPKQFRRKAGG